MAEAPPGDGQGDRTLLLLRHAAAEDFRPGHPDVERRLTATGRAQAERVGVWLRTNGPAIEHILCSPATRTRQTAAALALDVPIELADPIYDAGSDTLLDLVRRWPASCRVGLLIGHGPGVPQLALDLAGPGSDPAASAGLQRGFGPGSVARLAIDGVWSTVGAGRLVELRPAN